MKYYRILLAALTLIASISCQKNKAGDDSRTYTRFNGNYSKTFNDLHDVHIKSAIENGVGPLQTRSDTSVYSELERLPDKSDVYKIDKLTHSVPFLTSKASDLLDDIGNNFQDSLISKDKPIYKIIVTSVTRTDEDVKKLQKRNSNASDNSAHCYGTTFDIAWTRFEKVDKTDSREMDDGKLKAILGQVLHDLRERDRCYIKHEKKQSCFHITVR